MLPFCLVLVYSFQLISSINLKKLEFVLKRSRFHEFNNCLYVLVNTLSLGKPEKGKMVESMLIRMAQSGQIRGKIDEKDLIGILESVNSQLPQSKTSVKFDRRRAALDSDDDDF